MTEVADEVRKVLRQQAAIAGFGSFSLRQCDLLKVLNEAAKVCAEGLNVPFSNVCRYRPEENDLLVEAGYGWHKGVIGHVVSRADQSTPQGRAFITGEPSICNDIRKGDFVLPPFYAEHGIVSTIDVVIKGEGRPYGILEIDNDRQHDYDQNDVNFLTGFANVLAEAVATSLRTSILRATIEEKERLLEQKNILAEELQHRVRNNMQLVYAMLSKLLEDTTDLAGKRRVKSVARRVSTLALVYDHLLGSEMTRTTDFGGYVKSLCQNIADIQATNVKLTCDCDRLVLDLDHVTALGIVVAELVTNSFDHAFPEGTGSIDVSVQSPVDNDDMATLKISDNGVGFVAEAGSKRHGLGLVQRLIQQVRGTSTVDMAHGTSWNIKFPVARFATPSPPLPRS